MQLKKAQLKIFRVLGNPPRKWHLMDMQHGTRAFSFCGRNFSKWADIVEYLDSFKGQPEQDFCGKCSHYFSTNYI